MDRKVRDTAASPSKVVRMIPANSSARMGREVASRGFAEGRASRCCGFPRSATGTDDWVETPGYFFAPGDLDFDLEPDFLLLDSDFLAGFDASESFLAASLYPSLR